MARKRKIEIPLILVELEDDNYHILLDTQFSDHEFGKWVIDTGASKTVFDINQNEKYSLTENQLAEIESTGIGDVKIETKTGIISNMKIGELSINEIHVGLIDLSHLNTLYKQFTNERIFGLIGSDLLFKYKAVIDYKNLKLILQYQ